MFAEAIIETTPSRTAEAKRNWRVAFADFVATKTSHPTFVVTIHLTGYKVPVDIPFNVDAALQLLFEEFRYSVHPDFGKARKKYYAEPILSDEAEEITGRILRATFETIKSKTAKKQ